MVSVITGLEQLLYQSTYKSLKDLRIGLVTNHTSVTKELKFGIDELLKENFKIKKIFSPEHGFRGNNRAGDKLADEIDERTGLPVYSLYGDTKRPTADMVKGLDALIFDIQDIGVRFYTYIYTMAYCMEAAKEHNLQFIVLDRANPITGVKVEGNILDENFQSFVGLYPIPLRHGMTVGELAQMFNEHFQIGCSLKVISLKNWERSYWFDETKLPWVMPSPNSTSLEMATLYPGTCLFEGTNLSEGRGTTKPFEIVGASWINGYEWAKRLNQLSLPGVIFRETFFTPYTSKYQGELCQGVQVHVTDREVVKPVEVGIAMIAEAKQLYPNEFQWFEAVPGRFFIDLLMGTNEFRKIIDEQKSIEQWLAKENSKLESFKAIREKYLLY
ncbi:DUF1343 domain-containing protein [Anaerobacillus alkaliphilus]|uniref:DUF1343 domain-containing protein n=1 Tax=Anaerobacillus alkaliphilus TaxID=1548597 RepID=A0A4V1LGP3_9BACI|nr:DUF1343 domain-containing protein [Anaerobacillus alkaliphilus]RXJ02552.1 DUF1343 domain-containing protein [Anaerobacillus alkaliphilus]